MKNRSKHGFHWMCGDCLAAPNTDTPVTLSDVSSLISDSMEGLHTKLSEILNALEEKVASVPGVDSSNTQSFANILKETLETKRKNLMAEKQTLQSMLMERRELWRTLRFSL